LVKNPSKSEGTVEEGAGGQNESRPKLLGRDLLHAVQYSGWLGYLTRPVPTARMRGMKLPITCERCGGVKLVPGHVSSSFVPKKEHRRSFLSYGPEEAGLQAIACLTCGAVSFWADPDGVKATLADPPA
jgi:hypothetical protein